MPDRYNELDREGVPVTAVVVVVVVVVVMVVVKRVVPVNDPLMVEVVEACSNTATYPHLHVQG